MLRHRAVGSVLGVLLLALSTPLVAADTFTHPPESSTAPGEWESLYPYPRNATIDFATDPWDSENPWPTDPDDPTGEGDWAKDLIPGLNYDVAGWDDAGLYEGDWCAESWPYLTWYADDPAGSGRTGIIELYNEGPPPGSAPTMYWHLSNSSGAEAKHIWLEIVVRPPEDRIGYLVYDYYFEVGAVVEDDGPFGDPCWVGEPELRFRDDLAYGWVRDTWYIEIEPSPDWELITWTFQPPLSGMIPPPPNPPSWYLDEIHIATEAVPEPGTIALFGLGLLGVAARLRRRCSWRR